MTSEKDNPTHDGFSSDGPRNTNLKGLDARTIRRRIVSALVLALLAFCAYIPCLHGEFLDWDDQWMIRDNLTIASTDRGLHDIWLSGAMPDYYPLTYSLFWLQWHNGNGQAWVFHLVNLLMHTAVCLLLWDVLRRLEIPGAWLAAALFAIHPINVATAAWMVEQKNTLSMLLALVAVECYLESLRRRRVFESIAGLVAFVASLLSKAAFVPLPAALLVIHWWRGDRLTRRRWLTLLPWFLLSAVFSVVTLWVHYHRADGLAHLDIGSPGVRLLRAGWAVWFYLGKIAWPLNLMPIYPRWSVNAAAWAAYLPLAAVCLLAVGLFVLRRHPWSRAMLAALAIFLIMLCPVLGFTKISFFTLSFVADHWVYAALPAAMALIGAAAAKLPRRPGIIVALVLLAGYFTLSWRRSALYADSIALWRDNEARNPSEAVLKNLADSLHQRGRTHAAEPLARRAVALAPDNWINRLCLAGILKDQGKTREAIAQYERTIQLNPNKAEALDPILKQLKQEVSTAGIRRNESPPP